MIKNNRFISLCEYFNILCNWKSYNNDDIKNDYKRNVIYIEMMKIIGKKELIEFEYLHGKLNENINGFSGIK